MTEPRTRLSAVERRAAVVETACRVFAKSSYHGSTTAQIAREEEPSLWIGTLGKAYLQARAADRVIIIDLWIQALGEAADDPVIRRRLREQVREVHDFVAGVIRRAQEAGGIVAERDADAEAWIFISLGLLTTIDRRLTGLVGDEFDDIVASRRAWMTGTTP